MLLPSSYLVCIPLLNLLTHILRGLIWAPPHCNITLCIWVSVTEVRNLHLSFVADLKEQSKWIVSNSCRESKSIPHIHDVRDKDNCIAMPPDRHIIHVWKLLAWACSWWRLRNFSHQLSYPSSSNLQEDETTL